MFFLIPFRTHNGLVPSLAAGRILGASTFNTSIVLPASLSNLVKSNILVMSATLVMPLHQKAHALMDIDIKHSHLLYIN